MKKDYIILADGFCDLSKDLRDIFNITDYISGTVNFSDGRDFEISMDWEQISRDEFYSSVSNKKMSMSTAPASPEKYYEIFKSYAEKGMDILSMSLSSKISSSYDNAGSAARRIKEEFPECNIYCVDSFKMSGAFGLLVAYAHQMKKDGKCMEEVIEWLECNKYKVHQMGPIDDLMFVARRGRISTGKAIMGSFAGVKPMGDCNGEGYVSVLGKVKGIKKALDVTVEYIKLMAVNPEEQYIFIHHSDREEYANTLKQLIEEKINPKTVFVSDVFMGCGPNIGPGMVCAYFIGEKITDDAQHEKEMLHRAIESI